MVDTRPVSSPRGIMEGVWEYGKGLSSSHSIHALRVLPPILSLLNFYPDNFPPQIFFPVLLIFLNMT